jgi:hypothetical protein
MKLILTTVMYCMLGSSAYAQILSSSDENLLNEDFRTDTTIMSKPQQSRRIIFLGKIKRSTLTIAHYNDLDLTGIVEILGYPDDDDLGRTAGLVINYLLVGESGSLEVNLENWLFTQDSNNPM